MHAHAVPWVTSFCIWLNNIGTPSIIDVYQQLLSCHNQLTLLYLTLQHQIIKFLPHKFSAIQCKKIQHDVIVEQVVVAPENNRHACNMLETFDEPEQVQVYQEDQRHYHCRTSQLGVTPRQVQTIRQGMNGRMVVAALFW